MEYQFIRDPITGYRVRMSQEHALVGRWLNEELAIADVEQFVQQMDMLGQDQEEIRLEGKEVRLTLSKDEALFEAHTLYQNEVDLSRYEDDFLELDEDGLMAVCGFEDFRALMLDWQAFTQGRR
ncbi:YacL family protein [Pseudoalteromonas luteoviolacea]|uniref:YacL family protein n=1 Tax=Pseudoalteromonas luteoviolacea TaxID=43657 RepID=UPI001B35840A|nr:YacL family protein [Pseudoalteromonas luteoviolacea]MBQ4838180.1 YacL family protein [Pseudoalteromonas luteoviolacea]